MKQLLISAVLAAGCATRHASTAAPGRSMLIDSVGDNRAPAWSPDGKRIAFETSRDGNWEIYIADASGVVLRRVTNHGDADRHPAWSPSGDQLVYARSGASGSQLITVRLTDSTERVIAASSTGAFLFPHWSPSGAEIAFTRQDGVAFQLHTVAVGGGGTRALLPASESRRDVWPRWSADGTRLAFFSRRPPHGDDDEVYVHEFGGRLVRVTTRAGHDFTPDWSPDGRRLVVAVTDARGPGLSVITLGGDIVLRLAAGFSAATEPAWHPDGRRIAYAARAGSTYSIHIESARARTR